MARMDVKNPQNYQSGQLHIHGERPDMEPLLDHLRTTWTTCTAHEHQFNDVRIQVTIFLLCSIILRTPIVYIYRTKYNLILMYQRIIFSFFA